MFDFPTRVVKESDGSTRSGLEIVESARRAGAGHVGPAAYRSKGKKRVAPGQPEGRSADEGAVLVLVQRGLETLGGLAFAAIVPRTLGPDAFGRYAFLISVAVLFALVGGLGLNNATARYLPPLAARGAWD